MQNVTWSVNGTNSAPVSTANVKISLSTDGGNTFPIVLAASVPNTGTAAVTLPNGITTSTARIKVEAVGNIFFDISDANFALVPSGNCPAVNGIAPQAGNPGTVLTITGLNFTGVNAVIFSGNVPAASFMVNNAMQISATVPAGAAGGPITLSKPGCPNVQTPAFSVCPNRQSKSRSMTVAWKSPAPWTTELTMNRLTPASYPATVNQVSIFWTEWPPSPPGTPITVIAGAHPSGTANIDGTSFVTTPATVGAQPGFTTYTLSNSVTITSGDFIVGYQIAPDHPSVIAIDANNPMSRSYVDNGTTFVNPTNTNFMIRAAQVFIGCSAGAPAASTIVSRKLHGGTPYHIPLPLTGSSGIERRSGGVNGDHQIIMVFPSPVTISSASVTTGTGSVSNFSINGTIVTVNLTGVSNAQRITVTLQDVSDGPTTGDLGVPMGVLIGDTNDGFVNAGDALQTRSRSGQPTDASNFRSDVNADGFVNSADTTAVRSRSGDISAVASRGATAGVQAGKGWASEPDPIMA